MPNSRPHVDPLDESCARSDARLVTLLQRHLPLRARMAAKARGAAAESKRPSPCSVTQVFDAGGEIGLVCQLQVADARASSAIVLAPITQLSFDRGSPVFREIILYQKRRRVSALGETRSAR